MSDAAGSPGMGVWHTPECPFTVEYSAAVMEEIRHAVVDAFFAVPRGGAETGGVLFGRYAENRLSILAQVQLDCEHAHGPSFVLSRNDHERLFGVLETYRSDPELAGMVPVGWYHSHTRSEIHLSHLDLNIHDEYFPAPWQVALVLKPANMQPTRAGFFFRGPQGEMRSDAACREFLIEAPGHPAGHERPDSGRPARRRMAELVGIPDPRATRSPAPPPPRSHAPAPAPVLSVPSVALQPVPPVPQPAAPAPQPVAAPPVEAPEEGETAPLAKAVPPPAFLLAEAPPRRSFKWLFVLLPFLLAGAGYATRQYWLPMLPRPAALSPIGLTVSGEQADLRFQWSAAAAREAQQGSLEIADGNDRTLIPLDSTRLLAGSYSYTRKGSHVSARLSMQYPDGRNAQESTIFIGTPLEPKSPAPEAQAADENAKAAEKILTDLKSEQAKTRKLERTVQELQNQLRREQQRRRMENQNPSQ